MIRAKQNEMSMAHSFPAWMLLKKVNHRMQRLNIRTAGRQPAGLFGLIRNEPSSLRCSS